MNHELYVKAVAALEDEVKRYIYDRVLHLKQKGEIDERWTVEQLLRDIGGQLLHGKGVAASGPSSFEV